MNLLAIVKYLDLFGNRITFYNEKMPKLYTVTGGVFSIVSILVCIMIFIIFSLNDLKRKVPITTMSSIPSEGYKNIKFGKEKIWIPWRIIDYNNKFVNHTGLLFPIIYYYSGTKDPITNEFNFTTKKLDYKLCSETSMNKTIEDEGRKTHQISVPLNEIFCIDMDDLDMGGSWLSEFINYVEFDLYYCEDGISYDQNNSKCATYKKITDSVGENNSLEFALYYPNVQFQPTNNTNPIIIVYRQFFYHLSKYSNKIERFFLQENVFTDDTGWLLTKESNKSFWGLSTIQGDSYVSGEENDLMNEGSNSRGYSFNIYLEPGIIHYKRYYKKFHTILSDFFPLAYIIFILMKKISKFFKKAENNKKMVELLFENLKEKPNVFEENLQKLRIQNSQSNRRSFNSLSINKKENDKKKHRLNIDFQYSKEKSNVHHSSFILNNELLINKKSEGNSSINMSNMSNIPQNSPQNRSNKAKRVNSKFGQQNKKSMNNTSNQFLITQEKNNYQKFQNVSKSNETIKYKKEFVKEKLFPYKYYLCSVFIRNLDISKKQYIISSRFAKIYIFLCQLIDITTYLSLLREFSALKSIFNDKSLNIIEKNKKININSSTFLKDISHCIGEQKFHILAQGNK